MPSTSPLPRGPQLLSSTAGLHPQVLPPLWPKASLVQAWRGPLILTRPLRAPAQHMADTRSGQGPGAGWLCGLMRPGCHADPTGPGAWALLPPPPQVLLLYSLGLPAPPAHHPRPPAHSGWQLGLTLGWLGSHPHPAGSPVSATAPAALPLMLAFMVRGPRAGSPGPLGSEDRVSALGHPE